MLPVVIAAYRIVKMAKFAKVGYDVVKHFGPGIAAAVGLTKGAEAVAESKAQNPSLASGVNNDNTGAAERLGKMAGTKVKDAKNFFKSATQTIVQETSEAKDIKSGLTNGVGKVLASKGWDADRLKTITEKLTDLADEAKTGIKNRVK